MSVKPVGFLVIKGGEVELVQLTMGADKANVALDMLPGLIDKVAGFFKKDKDKDGEEPAEAELVEE